MLKTRLHKLLDQLLDTPDADTIQMTYFEGSPLGRKIRYDVRIDVSIKKEEFDESSEMEK